MLEPYLPIEAVDVSAYEIPTDAPESDGTLEWNATTLVLVELRAEGRCGLGYTYAHRACACCATSLRHLEYFHDHVRIETMLFEGSVEPDAQGNLCPDLTQPGLGLAYRHREAERYRLA